MSVWKMLGFGESSEVTSSTQTETVRKIVKSLDQMDPERARFVAAFAFILSRVANADMEVSDAETLAMERIVVDRGKLPQEQSVIVVQMAKTQNILFGGTENFLVTREFNKLATRDEKLALVDCLFAVGAADESISTAEDSEIRQICQELLLEQRDFIRARLGYREYLSVLKDSQEGQ